MQKILLKNYKGELTLKYIRVNEIICKADILNDKILKIHFKLFRKKKKRKY